MDVSLKFMRYFVVVAAEGRLAQAATRLNVAPSALAAAMSQIEAALGMKLLHRQKARGVTLTASGRVMLRKFQELLDSYDAMMAEGADLQQALSGTLRVGYYAPIAPAFLPRVLQPLMQAGQTTLHLEACDNDRAQSGLLAGDFDVIFFVSDAALPQVHHRPLISAPPYCLMPAAHPLAQQSSVGLLDMAQEPLIVLDRPVAFDYYRQIFTEAGGRPAVFANSTEMVRSAVGAGQGLAILNMLPLSAQSYAGDALAARPIRDDLPPLTLAIGYDGTAPRNIVSHVVEQAQALFQAEGARFVVG